MKDFFKLLPLFKPYKHYIGLAFLFNFLATVFSLFTFSILVPFLNILFKQNEAVYDKVPWSFSVDSIEHNAYYFLTKIVEEQGEVYALVWVCIFLVASVMLKTGFTYLGDFVNAPLQYKIVQDIYSKLYNKLLNLPVGYFTEERKGDIMSRMSTDVNEILVSIVSSIHGFIKHPLYIIVYFGALIYISPIMTGFILLLLPISGLVIGKVGKSLRKTNSEAREMQGAIMSMVEETLSGLRVIQAFGAKMFMSDKFAQNNAHLASLSIKIHRKYTLASPFSEFMGSVTIAGTILFGGNLVLNQADAALEASKFILYIVVFSQIISPAKAFSVVFYNIQKGVASVDRINAILNAPSEIENDDQASPISDFNESIEFRNVNFSYGEKQVLKNVSFTLKKGQSIALVGKSGSGKTTIANLLPRFYNVTDGEILIDGKPVNKLKLHDLRKLIGVVTQESILFNDNFRNNIALGIENATQDRVEDAAKIANAHEFIVEKEGGYDANIGDSGSKLSGGQRQRLSIARAVLKNPPILILDEATSALDTQSEKLVQDALIKLMKSRSSLVIAHRLSTIKNADLIIVMNDGQIVETGTHDELLALGKVYKNLHDMQLH